MTHNLIGFITSDGSKHLGYYTPIVNPCGDWQPDSPNQSESVEMYTDEYGNEYQDVKATFDVCAVSFYYWDFEQDRYEILPAPTKNTLAERTAHLFSADLVTNDKEVIRAYLWTIREWLLLNAEITMPVYIDKELAIHSEGKISIHADAADMIPQYIKIENK